MPRNRIPVLPIRHWSAARVSNPEHCESGNSMFLSEVLCSASCNDCSNSSLARSQVASRKSGRYRFLVIATNGCFVAALGGHGIQWLTVIQHDLFYFKQRFVGCRRNVIDFSSGEHEFRGESVLSAKRVFGPIANSETQTSTTSCYCGSSQDYRI